MNLTNGKLGVVVIILALTVAILGGWALSTDVQEVQVTKYNPIADITGLFEGTETPEYIEYSPSTNYTGYYTDSSVYNGTKYFDGVDFAESNKANQYLLKLNPTVVSSGSVTLSDYTGTYPLDDEDFSLGFWWIDEDNGYERYHSNTTGTLVSLSSYIQAMGITSGAFTIKSNSDIQDSDMEYGTQADADWILLTTRASWYNNGSSYGCVVGTEEFIESRGYTAGQIVNDRQINLPFLSCTVDLTTKMATLYTDNECENSFGVYSLDDVFLLYGGSGSGSLYINFDTTAEIDAATIDTAYMDPSQGVELV